MGQFIFEIGDMTRHAGISLHPGSIKIEFFSPDYPGIDAQLNNLFKKVTKNTQSVAFPNFGQ